MVTDLPAKIKFMGGLKFYDHHAVEWSLRMTLIIRISATPRSSSLLRAGEGVQASDVEV